MKTSLILHSRPSGITWSGPTFLTSDDALTDGKPARSTRVEFEGGSLTDYVALVGVWSTPTIIRGAVIVFDRNVPSGAKIEIRGKQLADPGYTYLLGGNALTQRTIERDDGTIAAAFAFDEDVAAIVGLEIRVFDDANGVTYAGGYIDIGEVFFGQGTEVNIRREVNDGIEDPTERSYTLGNQPDVVQRKWARTVDVDVCPTPWDESYMTADSLMRLRNRLAGQTDCAIILGFRAPATGKGATDWDVVQRTTVFGKCIQLGDVRSLPDAPLWVVSLGFRESPGRLV